MKFIKGEEDYCRYRHDDWEEFLRNELLAGKSRYTIYMNMKKGRYPELEGSNDMSQSAIYQLIDKAYDTCKVECEEDRKKQREIAYERFLDLYREAREKGERQVAKQILDSIAKLTGLNEPDKVELSDTTLRITLV